MTLHTAAHQIAIVILLLTAVVGCSRPDLTEVQDDNGPAVIVEPRLGIQIVNAEFWTNGTLRSDRIDLRSEDFRILYVYLRESGLYIVTAEQTESSVRTGQFAGNEVSFSGGTTQIRFRSASAHVFSDGVDRDAWVEFIAGVTVKEVEGAVVGLVRDRSHVLGL